MIPIKPGKSLGKSDVIFNNSMLSSTWKNTNRPLIMCARDEKVNTFDGESNFKYELDKTASFDISVKATYDGKDINVTSSVLPCLDTDEGTEYSVAYVLTADGLKNEKWGQGYLRKHLAAQADSGQIEVERMRSYNQEGD